MFAQPSPRQSQSHSSRSSIGGQRRRSRRARRTRCRLSRGPLAFEPLEDRTLLSVFTVSTPDDVIDATDGVRSLREAVIAANANPGPDQISLEAATYSLTRAGAGEDGAFSGDLDIFTDELLILGDSASTSIIDAGGTIGLGDRVFHVRSTATISGVTIRGGVTTGFGGGSSIRAP